MIPFAPALAVGDWRADIAAGPPEIDRTRPKAYRFNRIEWTAPDWLPDGAHIASVNYFPPGGGGLGWHTDSSLPGWRVYVSLRMGEHPGEVLFPGVSFVDAPGFAMAFYVSGRPCESWHAVRAESARVSVGLRINEGATARRLGLI